MADVRTIIATAEKWEPANKLELEIVPPPDYQDEERPEVRAGWRIGSEEEADWAFERLAEHERQVAAIVEQLAAAIKRLTAMADRRKATAVHGVQFFSAALMEYGEREKASLLGRGKKKSRAFLHGTIGWRKKGGKLTWVDDKLALEWAKSRPVEEELYRVKYELDKARIQEVTRAESIIPPGCELEPERDEVYVKTAAVEG